MRYPNDADKLANFAKQRAQIEQVCGSIGALLMRGCVDEVLAPHKADRDALTASAHGLQESVQRLLSGKFQIAFVGQMKAGKSTLVNAIVFGQELLPVASTPQTAKLTVIKHAKEPSAKVHFYTEREWAELEARAQDEGLALPGVKLSYSKKLQETLQQHGQSFRQHLGRARTIKLTELNDYVAAYDPSVPQGRFSNLTNLVEVSYPTQWPEDVELVDTPGTNDPDELREKVTRDYLSQADAVVLVLYAGRPGDREDINFLKQQLLRIGFGKLIIALNKFDMVPEEEGSDLRA